MNELNRSASSKLVNAVVALGKEHSKHAFPNPTREDCPSRSTLRAMAHRDRRLTLEDLPLSHIVTCSPCFEEYARLRRMSVLVRGIQIAAASMVVLTVVFIGARSVRNYASRSGEPSLSEAQRVVPPPPLATTQPPSLRAPVHIGVDLASFSPTRGSEAKDNSGNTVHLPRTFLRVNLHLPLGMEPGEYAVRLLDSTGQVVADKRAVGRIEDGRTSVEIDIDLAGVTRGSFTLTIRPPGLGWREFPTVVE